MKRARWLATIFAVATALGAIGCADQGSDHTSVSERSESGELGTLALNLQGTDKGGRQYRLRHADFRVTNEFYAWADAGPAVSKVLSSEDSLDQPTLSVLLSPGPYQVVLEGDWYLEVRVDGEWQRVRKAVLLDGAVRFVYIQNRFRSFVSFAIGVDGELIDFRHGELQIGIEIEHPEDSQDAGWWLDSWPPSYDAGVPGRFDGGTIVD